MTTAMKVQETKSVLDFGVDEIDMTINVGFLLSGMYQETLDDIRAVKQTMGNIPLKVIIECHYLNPDLMCRAAEMVVEGGAQWVKTGTGWAPSGATYENIALLKKAVGNSVQIKAAGGVRNLETIQKMVELGAERFGVGGSVQAILEEAAEKDAAVVA
jgi:deoxyribose-phosphate aldolase